MAKRKEDRGRFSSKRKMEAVLRVVKGETLDAVSRELGVTAAKPGTRYEALEPVNQAVRERLGAICPRVAKGLKLRHDHGSQYVSDAFQHQLAFLGIESSPSFVRAPEGNGCIERLIRTLKEQLLWLRPFRNVEELRLVLHEWRQRYNTQWLIEGHGFLTPDQARRELEARSMAA